MDKYYKKTRRPTAIIENPKAKPVIIEKPNQLKRTERLTPPEAPRKRRPEPPDAPKKRKRPDAFRKLFDTPTKLKLFDEQKPSEQKIDKGPLKGISTSLLELVRAKEAALKNVSPEQERKRELLGIAPDLARIISTIYTASKRDIILFDKVVDNCCKSLKNNYTSQTIDECITLMAESITPEWISIVTISRGKFMRLDKDKYTMPQLLEVVNKYKKKNY